MDLFHKGLLYTGFFAPAIFFIFRSTSSLIRTTDVFLSALGLLFLSPVFICISILIKWDSKGSVFFAQQRVGRNNNDFFIYKFRTMSINAQKYGALTVGSNDHRITKVGYYLRKYKLDELPQLFNVFIGQMSLVGPRPEIRKYVNLYTDEQKKVLSVRPGITDHASIKYRKESDLLKTVQNPEAFYINEILPEKIELSKYYIDNMSIANYIGLIIKTFLPAGKFTQAQKDNTEPKKIIRHIHIPADPVSATICASVSEHSLTRAAIRV